MSRRMLLAFVLLIMVSCDSPASRLKDNFEASHGTEPWFSAVEDIEVNGSATIVITTRLDPLDPNVERLGVEICEAMAETSPSEDEVFVEFRRLVPGEQAVDGSYEEPTVEEDILAETISFAEDTCEAELYPTYLEAHRAALEQLNR